MAAVGTDLELSDLTKQLCKLTDPASAEAPPIIKSIRHLLRSGRPFLDLRASPKLPDGKYRNVQSPPAFHAIRNLRTLTDVVVLPQHWLTPLLEPIHACLREIWFSLVPWIEYVHPMHHVGTRRQVQILPVTLTRFFFSLFPMKAAISDLLEQTPQMYGMLFDLWLHLDVYLAGSDRSSHLFDFVNWLGNVILYFAVWIGGEYQASLALEYVDGVAIEGARWIVKDRPRAFYRLVVAHARRLLDALPDAENQGQLLSFMAKQIRVLTIFTDPLLPIPCMPRDVVLDLVSILRKLQPLASAHVTAVDVCVALHAIWQTAEDARSLLWALRAGVLPLIIALDREESLRGTSACLRFVAASTSDVGVARAMPVVDWHGVLPDGMKYALQERLQLARATYRKVCAYDKCPKNKEEGCASIRRCPCLSVCYCSSECQTRDWPWHRDTHYADMSLYHIRGNLCPLNAHFLTICGRQYLQENDEEIQDGITQVLTLDGGSLLDTISCVVVEINLGQLPPVHQTMYGPPNAMHTKRIVVTACARGAGMMDPAVMVLV